jgi:glycosyltransferase involved in cell wall biosynthesis
MPRPTIEAGWREEGAASGGRRSSDADHVILVSHGFQANYERGFINGLADNGVNATLVSSDRTDYAALSPRARTVNLRRSQQEDRPRAIKLLNLLRYHLSLCIYALVHRRSTVHVIGLLHPPVLCGVVEGLFFRLVCARYVLTVHDLLPHDRHTPMNRRLFGLCFKIPHRLVVHTRRMKQRLEDEFGIRADRISIMEHGIEPLEAQPLVAGEREPGAPLRFLFFGLVAPYKGLDILLQAFAGLSAPAELLVMGRAASDDVRRQIRDSIAALGLRDRVRWRDEFIPEAELPGLFASADALVLPYRSIDQSGVLFQALRFGLPIIASRVGSFEDYVSADIGLIFEPGDADDLSRCLATFAASARSYQRPRIAEFGRTFEWSRTVRALDLVYPHAPIA